MAAAHWRQMRIWTLERQGDKTLSDYEMRLDRQFFRSLDRYLRLRTVSGETNPAALAVPTPEVFSDPRPEPEITGAEPKSTQAEPVHHLPRDLAKDDPSKGNN